MVDPLFISDTAEVRRLARSAVTNDFTDAQIIIQQKAAYSDIIIQTHKSDWSILDNRFYKIQKIEQQLAAAYVLEYYGDGSLETLNMIAALRTEANASLKITVTACLDVESDVSSSTVSSHSQSL